MKSRTFAASTTQTLPILRYDSYNAKFKHREDEKSSREVGVRVCDNSIFTGTSRAESRHAGGRQLSNC